MAKTQSIIVAQLLYIVVTDSFVRGIMAARCEEKPFHLQAASQIGGVKC
jgi:hypothetical protein